MKFIFSLFLCSLSLFSMAQNKNYSVFVDGRDNTTYKTLEIAKQVWMWENLNIKLDSTYSYANNESNANKYGRLYSWKIATKACPQGWHLPSKQEWIQLSDFLGGDSVAGGKMKSTGVNDWLDINLGATNSSSFSGLPAGYRDEKGNFDFLKKHAVFWSSKSADDQNAWGLYLSNESEKLFYFKFYKDYAFSVRCIKNS